MDKKELTRCESVILAYLCKGLLRKQIADKQHRSLKTINKHIENMQAKLDAHNSVHLASIAVAKEIIKISVRNVLLVLLCVGFAFNEDEFSRIRTGRPFRTRVSRTRK